ncbi:acyltransferase [Microbacterium sp. Sa4CUA7]|uniref:Acyltransferase n=1 Tax=Microbacterium pullorum TaxID=2762236 RepID=A0ABR8S157_9MICO|nr:SGNH hydrolase domain-containing protein [Microbacterium pullorum]MBD7957220.1 acyltransferase [Microbacterium pullorum]
MDGLRALAIALVVVYHVWTTRVSGGVDVFLMISAYFLTASFIRRAESGAPLRLGTYWLGRFRRLLPAAAATLVGVLALVWAFFPSAQWPDLRRQVWASLLYVENWDLAASAVDYYARDTVLPSPLQHFWSLSVQGQVFLLWPLLILLCLAVARRLSASPRAALVVLFAAVFVGSLTYSVITTATNQTFAYFDTFARLWEFALGSLLALLAPWLKLPDIVAAALGWLGLAALVLCGVVLDVQGGFPGYLALWPTLAAAAIIVAGDAAPLSGPARLLSTRPLQRLSGVAYALYLVHWPVLITYMLITESTEVGLLPGAGIVALSLLLASLITRGVERPVARALADAPLRRAAVAIAVCVAVVALPLTSWQIVETVRANALSAQPNPGAAVLYDPPAPEPAADAPLLPLGTDVGAEWVALDGECTGALAPTADALDGSCLATDVADPQRTVLVAGDSHAQQWMGALEPLAKEEGWRIVALLKAGCALAEDEAPIPGVEGCENWREAVVQYAADLRPDLVVLMGTKSVPDSDDERMLRGLDRTIERLRDSGAAVLALRDNPRFDDDMFLCVEEHGRDSPACVRDLADVMAPVNPASRVADEHVAVADLTGYLCPDGACPAVIGGVVVYLDDNHLTRSYAQTLAPRLREEIARLTGW